MLFRYESRNSFNSFNSFTFFRVFVARKEENKNKIILGARDTSESDFRRFPEIFFETFRSVDNQTAENSSVIFVLHERCSREGKRETNEITGIFNHEKVVKSF